MEIAEIIANMPKPYYEDKAGVIFCGDCLEIMPLMPNKCVDLVLTDPPYGIAYKAQGETYMMGDTVNLFPHFLPLSRSILKDNGAIYVFMPSTQLANTLPVFQIYYKLHNLIVWDKKHGQPKPPQLYNFRYEMIAYGSKGLHRLNNCWDDIIGQNNVMGKKRKHPTQKPCEVVEYFIKNSTSNDNIILDPFLGSGTTAVAAKELGRKFIGIEINQKYCDIAIERLRQEMLF